jgi:hypothetical protein
MSYDAKRWYVARCSCVRPIIYQEGRGDYPLRCARCGGHLYTEPRPPHFERLTHTPIVDFRAVLRVLGWCVLGLLGYIAICIIFVVFGGQ